VSATSQANATDRRADAAGAERVSVLLCSVDDPTHAGQAALAAALLASGCSVAVLPNADGSEEAGSALAELRAVDGLTVLDPGADGRTAGTLGPSAYAARVETAAKGFDAILALGLRTGAALAQRPELRGRLCACLDEIPGNVGELTERQRGRLAEVAESARLCAVRTESQRSFLETEIPAFAGRTVLSGEPGGERLGHALRRTFGRQRLFAQDRGTQKLLLAGYDFKFMGELVELLGRDPRIELAYDKWPGTGARSRPVDKRLFHSADVIFCEWSAANAVWYSQHKRAGQKLIVRLHRFEMDRPWVHQIDYRNVDAFVVVSEHMAQRMRAETGVDPAQLHVIPNMVDTVDFVRPKAVGSEFRIGIAGIVPMRKRPDRALALARELRRIDPRFTLHIRGRLPSSYREFSTDGAFRLYYQELYRQFLLPGAGGDLHGTVFAERFGADMANWFRRMGWILSPSTDESFHLAVAEGMASGALPVLWDWTGAADIYRPGDVFPDDPRAIAEHIVETVRSGAWGEQSIAAQRFIAGYDTETVHRRWIELFRSL